MPSIDEYGRLVGDRPLLTGDAAGPIVPPMPAPPRPRSPKWPAVLKKFLKLHPTCEGCGRKAETAHHVVPFHVESARELDPTNLVAVCIPCHFCLAHLNCWNLWATTAREDLAYHLVRTKTAQEEYRRREIR